MFRETILSAYHIQIVLILVYAISVNAGRLPVETFGYTSRPFHGHQQQVNSTEQPFHGQQHLNCTTNVCTCDPGYLLDSTNNTCIPRCDHCQNGVCVAPNTCDCKPGYNMNNTKCEPVCRGCTHGDCTAPGECHCHIGYKWHPFLDYCARKK